MKSNLLWVMCACVGMVYPSRGSAGINPFIKYSPEWADKKFADCELLYQGYWLTGEEKRVVQAVNLFRTDPGLFARTIFHPYAQKAAPAALSEVSIPISKLWILQPSVYATQLARELYRKERLVNDSSGVKHRKVWTYRGTYKDEAELLCRMIMDKKGVARDLVFGEAITVIGVRIGNVNGQKVTVVAFELLDPLTDPREILFPWYVDFYTDENLQPIDIKSHPSDRYLKRFMKDNRDRFCDYDSVFADHAEISKIIDSLKKNRVMFKLRERDEAVDSVQMAKLLSDPHFLNSIYRTTSSVWSDMSYPGRDTEKGLHVYYVGRTSQPGSFGFSGKIYHLEVPAAKMFAEDSIGREQPAPSDAVRKFVGTIPKASPALLARKLTGPFKDEFDMVQAIHDWITLNISYHHDGLAMGSVVLEPDQVIISGKTICSGYAALMVEMCTSVGINAQYITGVARGEGLHAWCAIKIKGRWYLCDPTWGNSYYLQEPELFFESHYPDSNKWTLSPRFRSYQEFIKQ